MSEMKIWLASTSPRRRELIQNLGVSVEVVKNDVDEEVEENLAPERIVQTLAERKMLGAFKKVGTKENGIIVAGDTIVVHNGNILGKPCDAEDAFKMLSQLQGDIHTVYSGVACMNTETGKRIIEYSSTRVKMKSLSEEQMNHYIKTGEPMDKAGAYAIQGLGATIVEKIEGDYFTVVGLPLALLAEMLGRLGVKVL
ncbi:MAG: Maf family protein [Tuberibacillus sp.]